MPNTFGPDEPDAAAGARREGDIATTEAGQASSGDAIAMPDSKRAGETRGLPAGLNSLTMGLAIFGAIIFVVIFTSSEVLDEATPLATMTLAVGTSLYLVLSGAIRLCIDLSLGLRIRRAERDAAAAEADAISANVDKIVAEIDAVTKNPDAIAIFDEHGDTAHWLGVQLMELEDLLPLAVNMSDRRLAGHIADATQTALGLIARTGPRSPS